MDRDAPIPEGARVRHRLTGKVGTLVRRETIENWGQVAVIDWDKTGQREGYSALTRNEWFLDWVQEPLADVVADE